MKEQDLIKLICDYLEVNRYMYYRNNTGGFKTESGHFYRYGKVGSPDVIIILPPNGQYVGIEAKVGKNKLSESQMAFGEQLVKAGGRYVVVRDNIDDLMEELNHLN